MRIFGGLAGIGMIHYAFLRDLPEAGFYGVALLAVMGALSGPWPLRIGLGALAAASLIVAGRFVDVAASPYLLLVAPVFFNISAMVLFGSTLLPGRVPLITRFSRFDKKQADSKAVDRHTRILTVIWTCFFALIVAATIFMALSGAFLAASWLVSVLSPVGAAALFLLEHLYRYFRKDIFDQASVFRTIRLIAHPNAWRGLSRDV
jgi:uncharacterized membrane protein